MNYTLSEDVVVLLVTYTTTEAAALLKTTPRRVMMVCEYWDIQHCGSGRARKYTASQLVDIGLRARLLEAGLRKQAIDALIGPLGAATIAAEGEVEPYKIPPNWPTHDNG